MNELSFPSPTTARRIKLSGPVLLFGGPYSNLEASRALLAEAGRHGIPATNIVCTGDLAAYCANPRETIELFRDAGIHVVAGNCDIQLADDAENCGCNFEQGSACDLLSNQWYTFARRAMTDDIRAWLSGLPRRIDIEIAGQRLAVVHATPTDINAFVFASTIAEAKHTQFGVVPECSAIICGHSGIPFTQTIDDRLWHNPGVIGMPANDGTARGWYSILTPPEPPGQTFSVFHHTFAYDCQSAAARMRDAGLPEVYADALETGLWPNCDILPYNEICQAGAALDDGSVTWQPPQGKNARTMTRRPRTVVTAWPNPDRRLANAIPTEKFSDPLQTATGAERAHVALDRLETLWFNTGTLCNITCKNCYIESSPTNDRLSYISLSEVTAYLDEIREQGLPTREIAFTGGEPFMNPEMLAIARRCLERGFRVLILTNAMRPMQRLKKSLLELRAEFPETLNIRVSLDHYTEGRHEEERGHATFKPACDGLFWLSRNGFNLSIAGRTMWKETIDDARHGYAQFFATHDITVDAFDPNALVLFPEMDATLDIPEISTDCWNILGKSPSDVMCATSRMIVKRKGATSPVVLPCTLLPYDEEFELGTTLQDAHKTVYLNHPHCARFCVLGGASCSNGSES